ncbi:MAG: general secretion pathway protein GspK [Thermoguttaceae bacterium]
MNRSRGTVLVLVLVVVVILSLIAVTFSRLMLTEVRLANHAVRQRQVRLFTESGTEYLRLVLMFDDATILELGGVYDNPTLFCGQVVMEGISTTGASRGGDVSLRTATDERDLGRFSFVVPALSDDGSLLGDAIRYGLEDESTKINLHWILATEKSMPGYGKYFLMRLPGVTEEIAEAILDWIDDDDEPREFGAESEYYSTLDPPYLTRNRVPDSLDELLLVRGVTQTLLYGTDWNRNGLCDLGEPDDTEINEEYGVNDGSLNLGLVAYLTLDSAESMYTSTGLPKINVNQDDAATLRTELEERFSETEWIDYIIAYKQKYKINSLLDLVGTPPATATTAAATSAAASGNVASLVSSISGGGGQQNLSSLPPSPFTLDVDEMSVYLPLLYDNLTTSDKPVTGRININQASRKVLEAFGAQDDVLTEMVFSGAEMIDSYSGSESSLSTFPTMDVIEAILAARVSDPSLRGDMTELNYTFWVYTHGIVEDFEQFRRIEPYFCGGGAVFRTQVIGRFDDDRSPASRREVWLDASDISRPAKIIRLRDMNELGPGHSPDTLGVQGQNSFRP